MKHILMALAFGVAVSAPISHAADVDVEAFVKRDRFDDIQISPNGDYYAATLPLGDRTALAILRPLNNWPGIARAHAARAAAYDRLGQARAAQVARAAEQMALAMLHSKPA